jgi:hypothetical protein
VLFRLQSSGPVPTKLNKVLENASTLTSVLKSRDLLVSPAPAPPATELLWHTEQKVNRLAIRHQIERPCRHTTKTRRSVSESTHHSQIARLDSCIIGAVQLTGQCLLGVDSSA